MLWRAIRALRTRERKREGRQRMKCVIYTGDEDDGTEGANILERVRIRLTRVSELSSSLVLSVAGLITHVFPMLVSHVSGSVEVRHPDLPRRCAVCIPQETILDRSDSLSALHHARAEPRVCCACLGGSYRIYASRSLWYVSNGRICDS